MTYLKGLLLVVSATVLAFGCRESPAGSAAPSESSTFHAQRQPQKDAWPPKIEAPCDVASRKIPPGVLRETWGPAGLEADIYIFGCSRDLDALGKSDQTILEREARAILREYEGSLYWAQGEATTRHALVARLNRSIKSDVILDFRVRDMRQIDLWPQEEK